MDQLEGEIYPKKVRSKLSDFIRHRMADILDSGACPRLRSGVRRNDERDQTSSRHAGPDPASRQQ